MKSQIELAKEKGIEVGDRVKVVRTVNEYEAWVPSMDKLINTCAIVVDIHEIGVTLGNGFTFPVQSLEKVEAHSYIKIDAVMVVRKDNQEIITVSNNIHYVQSFYEDLTGVEIVPVYIVRKTDALIAELNKGEGV